MSTDDSKDSSESEVSWLSDSASESKYYSSKYREDGKISYIIGIPAPEDLIADLQQQLPLGLGVLNNEGVEAPLNQKTIVVNGRTHRCQEGQNLTIWLNDDGATAVNLKVSAFRYVGFKSCKTIRSLDISHTFICHLDIREQADLEELRLTNTNVRRLNLTSQKKLRVLHCNYTLLDYIDFSGLPELEELHVECLEYLKSNRIAPGSEVFVDGSQTVDSYQVKALRDDRMGSYIVSYPQMGSDEEVGVRLPEQCDELIDRDIKQCRELEICGQHYDTDNVIDAIEIIDYLNLGKLRIKDIECEHFNIVSLSQLISVSITRLSIGSLYIGRSQNVTKVEITHCEQLQYLNIEGCNRVEILDVRSTKIFGLQTNQLVELKKLDITKTKITQIYVSRNIKLEKLLVSDTKISHLDVSQLTELKVLYADSTSIAEVDVSRNARLEDLQVYDTTISQLGVRQLKELKKLDAQNSGITELDLTMSIRLEELYVGNTKISQLGLRQLVELKILDASNTNIIEMDVSTNIKLEELAISDTGVSHLDVSKLTELRKLDISETKINQIDVSHNTQLEAFDANHTGICKLSLGQLSQLKELRINNTCIREIDLISNANLTRFFASSGCRVLNCPCGVTIED